MQPTTTSIHSGRTGIGGGIGDDSIPAMPRRVPEDARRSGNTAWRRSSRCRKVVEVESLERAILMGSEGCLQVVEGLDTLSSSAYWLWQGSGSWPALLVLL
jgi:hypothetical protein